MFEKDFHIVQLMLETIEKIFRYTSDLQNVDDFENDSESFDATTMNFIALGEFIAKLSTSFRTQNSHVDWNKIYAFRNVIAHDYFGILPDEVWEIIQKHLPKLKNELVQILKA